jgi:hypothetical protein
MSDSLTLAVLILFYRRQFRELGYSRNLHEFAVCIVRPFLKKLSNPLESRKFCERHTLLDLTLPAQSLLVTLPA